MTVVRRSSAAAARRATTAAAARATDDPPPPRRLPCALLRGGTSKGVFLRGMDLPHPVGSAALDAVLLRLFGSSGEDGGRQVDGLGGADPLTSKLAVVAPSARDDADVDYSKYVLSSQCLLFFG